MYTVESQTTLETYKVTGKCPDLTVKYTFLKLFDMILTISAKEGR